MHASIYFHPEGYTTRGPKLMGRHVAGESFLRAFMGHHQADRFWVQVEQAGHASEFEKLIRAHGRHEPVIEIHRGRLQLLKEPQVAWYPGPGLGRHAWQRSLFGHEGWSLCGITHTTCSGGAMDEIAELLTAPVQAWDALICTSQAVRAQVHSLLQAQADYLRHRLGATRMVLPQLPVIPLGVHASDFEFSADARARARIALNVGEDELVVLFAGRLAFHAKAHPLCMYKALESAQQSSGKRVVLVEFGQHPNEPIRQAYHQAAALACPSVRVLHLDGGKEENRALAWSCADIFCSLSDNIQESFGLTPVEAMAAGLPVVVSDWDGYRDTVRDGVDGFRIPTTQPSPGNGEDLALRHALGIDTYDMYIGHVAMLMSVDARAAAQAFAALLSSPELRSRMGAAGKSRVHEVYDWSVVMRSYATLWSELNRIRSESAGSRRDSGPPWPARMDPFLGFKGHASGHVGKDWRYRLATRGPGDTLEQVIERALRLRRLAMVNFASLVLPDESEMRRVLEAAASGAASADDLLLGIAQQRHAAVRRSLAWFMKMNLLEVQE